MLGTNQLLHMFFLLSSRYADHHLHLSSHFQLMAEASPNHHIAY